MTFYEVVRIESEKIAEGLHGDDDAGDGFVFGNRLLEKSLLTNQSIK